VDRFFKEVLHVLKQCGMHFHPNAAQRKPRLRIVCIRKIYFALRHDYCRRLVSLLSVSYHSTQKSNHMEWTAEITNDPNREFELYIELLKGDQFKARIQRAPDGELELHVYGGPVSIPAEWLSDLLRRAKHDLKR
jgi:hypothetical protein